jgi:hypothetical protein
MRQLLWILRDLSRRVLGRSRLYRTLHHEELPDELQPHVIYVLGANAHQWSVAMLCPEGCQSVLQMNLLKHTRPQWALTTHLDGTVSMHPSVWRRTGCRAHFWLKRGVVRWC